MDFLPIRILASALVDVSLAILCGLLLARHWLKLELPLPSPRLPAATLCAGIVLQLLSLTAAFTGKSSARELLGMLPDILGTHAGAVLGLSLAAAALLFALAFTRSLPAQAAALVLCLTFRAGTGHAATENVFSLSQAAQGFHLAAMSVWSGGVLIAGLLVLPRLVADAPRFTNVLAALSRWSTWALAVVAVSGTVRGYTTLAGDYRALLHTTWGLTLLAKLLAVATALTLGALNRLQLRATRSSPPSNLPSSPKSSPQFWTEAKRLRATHILRAEAIAMLAILLLSATLANLPPPGD